MLQQPVQQPLNRVEMPADAGGGVQSPCDPRKPDLTIRGGPSIRHFHVLNDKRSVLTKDTDNNVAVYDVLKAIKVADLGPVDLDEEIKRRTKTVFVPSWFNVDLKTGVRGRYFAKLNK